MKNKNIFKILFFLGSIVLIFLFISWNSQFNKNNKYIEDKLLKGISGTSGVALELFDFDYDVLYVFEPYLSKSEMEKQIGFKSNILKETSSENMINMLFVKDGSPASYLYGYGSNNGYYVELPIGKFSKSELDGIRYRIITNEVGNSSGAEQVYLNYIFEF